MIENAISPVMFVLLALVIVVIGLILALLIERSYPAIPFDQVDITPTLSPDTADKLVGIVVVGCAVLYLISDYANDWMVTICR